MCNEQTYDVNRINFRLRITRTPSFFAAPHGMGHAKLGAGVPTSHPQHPQGLGLAKTLFFFIFLGKKWQFGHGKKWQIDCLCHTLWAIGILWQPPKWPQVCQWPPRWPGPHTLKPPWPFPNLAATFQNVGGATHALKKCISSCNAALCGPVGPLNTPHPNGPKCGAGH